jgi:hypothetical protein
MGDAATGDGSSRRQITTPPLRLASGAGMLCAAVYR